MQACLMKNLNNIATIIHVIVLLTHLYGHARDLCKSISDDDTNRKDEADTIGSAVYNRDSLTALNNVYS